MSELFKTIISISESTKHGIMPWKTVRFERPSSPFSIRDPGILSVFLASNPVLLPGPFKVRCFRVL